MNELQIFQFNDQEVEVKTDKGHILLNLEHVARCIGVVRNDKGYVKIRWIDIESRLKELLDENPSNEFIPKEIKTFISQIIEDGSFKSKECFVPREVANYLATRFNTPVSIAFCSWLTFVVEPKAHNEQKQLSPMELLKLQYQVLEEHGEKLVELDKKIETMALTYNVEEGQANTIKQAVNKRVKRLCCGNESNAYLSSSLRQKVYRHVWNTLKSYLNVTVYHNILRKDFDAALSYLESITLQGALLREVQQVNNQVSFDGK